MGQNLTGGKVCKRNCKRTTRYGTVLGTTSQDRQTKIGELEHMVRYGATRPGTRIFKLENRCTGNRTVGSNPTASPLFLWRNWPCSNYRDISAGYSHQIRQKATTENEVIHCRRSLYGGFSVPQFGGPVRSASIPAGQTVRSQTPALRPRRANRTNCLRLVGVVTGLATPPAQ